MVCVRPIRSAPERLYSLDLERGDRRATSRAAPEDEATEKAIVGRRILIVEDESCRRQPRHESLIARRGGRRAGGERPRRARPRGQERAAGRRSFGRQSSGQEAYPVADALAARNVPIVLTRDIRRIRFPSLIMRPPSAPSRFGPPNSSGCCFGEARPAANRNFVYKQPMVPDAIRILGVDPGLRNTGWGLSRFAGRGCAMSVAVQSARMHRPRSPDASRRFTPV